MLQPICQKKNDTFKTYFGVDFTNELTCHFDTDRKTRHGNIVSHIGDGKYVTTFLCDTGHQNGNELHNIFDNGIILVQNERTKKIVTELIARPNQIKRYWTLSNRQVPRNMDYIIAKCLVHEQKGYNEDKWD